MKTELRALLRLTAPLAVLQIAMSMLGAVGLAVVGRIGEVAGTAHLNSGVEQGAVGLGNMLFFVVAVLGLGVVLGFDPLISQALGAKERARARVLTWQAGYMGLFTGLALIGLVVAIAWALPHTNLDAATAERTSLYLVVRTGALVPFLVSIAARSYLQAIDITKPLLVGAVIANLVNVPLAWLLVLGDGGLAKIGLPMIGLSPMGSLGAAIAATASFMVLALILVRSAMATEGPRVSRGPNRALLKSGFALGAPLSIQLSSEVGAFALVSYWAGTLGPSVLAAHSVSLTLASFPFQISLAIGTAAAVRVGTVIGEAERQGTPDPSAPRRAGLTALGLGAALSTMAALTFALFPSRFLRLLSSDPEVLVAGQSLILIAAAFQLVDGAQAIAAGALRGAGDTRASLFGNLAGHYIVGLPSAFFLCFSLGWGAAGLWWGLSAGLAAVSILLVTRFVRISGGTLTRV